MAEILHEVTIQGSPDQIYTALTEQAGIAAWWTTGTKAEPTVGGKNEMTFYGGTFTIITKNAALEPGSRVAWDVEQGAPDWGNSVTFDLSAADNGTKLNFGHHNFDSTGGSYPMTNFNWAIYLNSLKTYIETGAGQPHNPNA
jgi:uncharacterized protein YndB with AHSA1/START domain